MELNGILLVNKPTGPTSYAVVNRLKRLTGAKKVGHTGTLDPLAQGLLVVCFGPATKTIRQMDSTKDYTAIMQLGLVTDTLDITGKVTETHTWQHISRADIEKVLSGFRGKIVQIPPMYSARHKDGKRLYELARAGLTVARKPKSVEISSLEVAKFSPPLVYLEISCSAGTYIRTLCDDIGRVLGCGGVLTQLVRTRVGKFLLSDAVELEWLKNEEDVLKFLIA